MGVILRYSLRNLSRDKIGLVIGLILLAVAVVAFIVFPMRAKSALRKMKSYGFEDRVLVMEKGNLKLAFSRVGEDLYQFVKTAPHVKIKDNEPLVSPYLQMSSIFGKKFLMLRGITDSFYKVRGETFKIVQGRDLNDRYDVLIGYLLPKRLGKQYDVGDFISLENRKWKIEIIFFDLDNTLHDNSKGMSLALKKAYHQFRKQLVPVTEEKFLSAHNMLTQRLIKEYREGKLQEAAPWEATYRFQQMFKQLKLRNKGLVAELAEAFYGYRKACVQIFPGVKEALSRLKKHYQLAILSNGPSELQRNKLRYRSP